MELAMAAAAAAGCTKKRKMAAASAGNWTDLQEELLDEIAKRLTFYADRIRLRAVCVSWRSALPETPNQLPRQFPLLMMLPRDPKERETTTTYEFFSIVENKSYFLDFPLEMSNKNFLLTSCYGWLIFEEKLSLSLFNPFTKARMELPSLNEYYPRGLGKTRVTKVVLSASPSSSDFMTIVLLHFPSSLLISKFGDKRWTSIENRQSLVPVIRDVIFFKQKIITLMFGKEIVIREVVLVDDGHGNPTIIKTSIKQILRRARLYFIEIKVYLQVLVEYDDDLFVITQRCDFATSRTVCTVHKFDWQKKSIGNIDVAEWSEVKSLGDRVYFPCLTPPSCFSVRDFPECKGNCIYFHGVDTDIEIGGVFKISGDHALPLFDLADKQFKPWSAYPQGGLAHKKCIWITPTPV